MFGHHLQIKLVKNKPDTVVRFVDVKTKEEFDALMAPSAVDVHAVAESVTKGVAKLVLAYMASDTLRKVVVHTIATKIT